MLEAADELISEPSAKGVKAIVKYGPFVDNIDVYMACRDALAAAKSGKARDALVSSLLKGKRLEQHLGTQWKQ